MLLVPPLCSPSTACQDVLGGSGGRTQLPFNCRDARAAQPEQSRLLSRFMQSHQPVLLQPAPWVPGFNICNCTAGISTQCSLQTLALHIQMTSCGSPQHWHGHEAALIARGSGACLAGWKMAGCNGCRQQVRQACLKPVWLLMCYLLEARASLLDLCR